MKFLFCFCFFFCFLLCFVHCSQGDFDPNYRSCLNDCFLQSCDAVTKETQTQYYLIFHKVTCFEVCKFDCIDIISSERIKRGLPVVKYFGHWPFTRYFGFEEPASVVFSLLNIIPHFVTFFWTTHLSSNMGGWIFLYRVLSVLTWIFSAFYHSRRTSFSALLDYSFALSFLLFNVCIILRRCFGSSFGSSPLAFYFFFSLVCLLLKRIYDMANNNVSFSEHMTLCISLSVLQFVLWMVWIFRALVSLYFSSSKSLSNLLSSFEFKKVCVIALCQLSLSFASLLELGDFPPFYGIVDAHSVWHLATVPITFIWYYFWYLDEREKDHIQ